MRKSPVFFFLIEYEAVRITFYYFFNPLRIHLLLVVIILLSHGVRIGVLHASVAAWPVDRSFELWYGYEETAAGATSIAFFLGSSHVFVAQWGVGFELNLVKI